jgi:hypothetical protein|tara:strand:- start:27613 stop:27996 length:384 start_codon:yes stop_codon:yes gene_type:complete
LTDITQALRQELLDAGLATDWTVQLDFYREQQSERIICIRPTGAGGIDDGIIQRQVVEVWVCGLGSDSPATAKTKAEALLSFFNANADSVPIYQKRSIGGIMPFKVSDDRHCYMLTIETQTTRNEVF